MSCSHASTTTVAWAFGEFQGTLEAEEAHTMHVASCADCTAALEALEAVEAATAPLAGALPSDAPPVTAPRGGPWFRPAPSGRVWGAVALVAALALGTVAAWVDDVVSPPASEPVATRIERPAPAVPAPAERRSLDVDRELDALELELDALRTDPSIL
jgi:hypothetical protein